MMTLDDVRRLALSLPQTTEGTHFRMPSFEVAGKHFAVVQKSRNRVLLFVPEPDAHAAVAADPTVFETERPGRPFGLWINLATVTPEQLQRLITLAWQAKGPG